MNYPECPIPREPASAKLDIELAEKYGKESRVLPLFEKFLFEYKYRQHYSFRTNKLLQCRWRSYVKNYEEREFAPFQFVDIRDFHFYNGTTRLLPEISFHRNIKFPYKLAVGPGVDIYGQMPIPQDMMMKRGAKNSTTKGKTYPKTTNERQNEIKDKK